MRLGKAYTVPFSFFMSGYLKKMVKYIRIWYIWREKLEREI